MAGSEELEQQLRALAARVADLESEVAALRAEGREETAARGPEVAAKLPGTEAVTTWAGGKPAGMEKGGQGSAAVAETGRPSLESRIGSQILNRVGILAVLAGASWFLKLAIDRGWIGPWPRVMVGMVVALGLYVGAGRFRRSGYGAFAHTLQAIGTGIAYLSLWTAFSVYHLLPGGAALLLMMGVTGGNSWLAWRQDSVLLAAYALAGGLATPALLWTGANHEIVLFCYLLLLDGAVVGLAALRPWSWLAGAGLAGTAVYYAGWWVTQFTAGEAGVTGGFLLAFFGLFTAAPFVFCRREEDSGQVQDCWLPIATGVLAFLGAERLLSAVEAGHGQAWIAAGLALIYGGLVRVWGRTGAVRMRSVYLGLALGFLTLVAPIGFAGSWHGAGLALFWLAEAVGAGWELMEWPEPVLRWSALGLVALTAITAATLGWAKPLPEPVLVMWNAHFAAAAVACGGFAALAVGMGRRRPGERWLSAASVLAMNAVALIALSIEIHHYWACGGRVGADLCAAGQQHASQTAGRFSYSVLCMVYGAGLMAAGFWRGSPFLRWQALVLLAFAVGKVFVFDASGLSSGYRVLSFLGLGALLLGVSFAYQKNWLALKGG
jgi:uncharacterized membrane protein